MVNDLARPAARQRARPRPTTGWTRRPAGRRSPPRAPSPPRASSAVRRWPPPRSWRRPRCWARPRRAGPRRRGRARARTRPRCAWPTPSRRRGRRLPGAGVPHEREPEPGQRAVLRRRHRRRAGPVPRRTPAWASAWPGSPSWTRPPARRTGCPTRPSRRTGRPGRSSWGPTGWCSPGSGAAGATRTRTPLVAHSSTATDREWSSTTWPDLPGSTSRFGRRSAPTAGSTSRCRPPRASPRRAAGRRRRTARPTTPTPRATPTGCGRSR